MDRYLPDHYRVLGVGVHAELAVIKEAYRKLSRLYHPDRHGGSARATECFQLISVAWVELSDPVKRTHYDRQLVLRDPLRLVDDPRAERALDVLDQVVKRLRRRPDALPGLSRGRDLRVQHTLSFARAMLGGTAVVHAEYATPCGGCKGQGTLTPEKNPICHVCQGVGNVRWGVRRELGECGFCVGRGVVLLAACGSCHGAGVVQVQREVTAHVPPRCRSGATLRVRGGGEQPVAGGPAGDLLVDVTVAPHPLLVADGDDLVCRVPVTYLQACAGAAVFVPTLEGVERLTLPPGSSSGRELRVPGRGLLSLTGKGRGALRVVVLVDVPERLTPEQLAAVAAVDALLGPSASARAAAFAQSVADLRTETPS